MCGCQFLLRLFHSLELERHKLLWFRQPFRGFIFQKDNIFVWTQKNQQAISILSLKWFILLHFRQLLLCLTSLWAPHYQIPRRGEQSSPVKIQTRFHVLALLKLHIHFISDNLVVKVNACCWMQIADTLPVWILTVNIPIKRIVVLMRFTGKVK